MEGEWLAKSADHLGGGQIDYVHLSWMRRVCFIGQSRIFDQQRPALVDHGRVFYPMRAETDGQLDELRILDAGVAKR